MKLFEKKKEFITINLDINIIKKYAPKPRKAKLNYGNYGEYLVEKLENGNQDAVIKSIGIIKNILVKSGCTSYEEFYKKCPEVKNENWKIN